MPCGYKIIGSSSNMKVLLLSMLIALASSCDGGGAIVNQTNDNRRGEDGAPTPFPTETECNRQCVRLSDGTWQVTIDCAGELGDRVVIVGVLPPNCDSISDITNPPINGVGSGFSGQTL